MDLDALVDRVMRLTDAPGTAVIGIAGAPGAGKTTLAQEVVARLVPGSAAYLPMDGFHLADVELRRLGRLNRKGAPDTFDAAGYAALLNRIRSRRTETVYAPMFERVLEQPVAGAIPVGPDVKVVVTEGNYLLVDTSVWRSVAAELDECWYLRVGDSVRRERLIRRHVQFGKSPDAARDWVREVDEPNARLVEATADRADLIVCADVS